MDQEPGKKKVNIFKKMFHYIVVVWIFQNIFGFYWCDKCQRLTRWDEQIRIQPTLDGRKAKLRIPYCTRCVAIEVSKKKKLVQPYRKIK